MNHLKSKIKEIFSSKNHCSMELLVIEQEIKQLEKRKGGYFYIQLLSSIVNEFPNKRSTRLICTIDEKLDFQCGLNHLGDGNYFIIISGKHLKAIDKQIGDKIKLVIQEDPNPLGVDMPEILEVILEQDHEIKIIFDGLTLGKKRSIIHQINRIKDIDKQIQKVIQLITESSISKS